MSTYTHTHNGRTYTANVEALHTVRMRHAFVPDSDLAYMAGVPTTTTRGNILTVLAALEGV